MSEIKWWLTPEEANMWKDCFAEGVESFQKGLSSYQCPYDESESIKYSAWHRGWQAAKINSEREKD